MISVVEFQAQGYKKKYHYRGSPHYLDFRTGRKKVLRKIGLSGTVLKKPNAKSPHLHVNMTTVISKYFGTLIFMDSFA